MCVGGGGGGGGWFVVLLPTKLPWSCQDGKTESPLLTVAKVPASGKTGISILMLIPPAMRRYMVR